MPKFAAALYQVTGGGTLRVPALGWSSVMDHGAVADGETNDAPAIQAALNALPSSGGVVYLPPGTYGVGPGASPSQGGVRVPDNVVLAGAGMGVTVLRVLDGTSADITGVVRTPSGVETSNVEVRDLTIDGNRANVTGSIDGFYCGVTPNSTATDTDIRLINVEIRDCSGYGFDPHERTTRLLMRNCVARDCGDSTHDNITLDAIYDSLIEGCVSIGAGRHGINVVTASTRVRLVGCLSTGSASNGITIQTGSKHIVLDGCLVESSTGRGIVVNGVAQSSGVDTTPGGYHLITGCKIVNSGLHGIELVGAKWTTISGCEIRDASQTTNNSSDAIRLGESGTNYSTDNVIVGNLITAAAANKPKYGIGESTANEDRNLVVANRISGMVTDSIRLLGADSAAWAAHNGTADHAELRPMFAFSKAGDLAVATGTHRIYNDTGRTLTIRAVRASVGTAPTGSSILIDVNVGGTTIFTTQSNRPTIAAASTTSGKVTNHNVTTIADGAYFTVDIDQVGSGTPGADLTVQILC